MKDGVKLNNVSQIEQWIDGRNSGTWYNSIDSIDAFAKKRFIFNRSKSKHFPKRFNRSYPLLKCVTEMPWSEIIEIFTINMK